MSESGLHDRSKIAVSMPKQAHITKSPVTPSAESKQALQELFDQRDRAQPGSREEKEAAEKILKAIFPDTNAG